MPRLESTQSRSAARAVLYDGGCGLCSAAARTIRRLDMLGRVEFLDVTTEWDEIGDRYPHLSQEACLADIHVADGGGRVWTGFEAYRSLAWVLPVGWIGLPLLYVPGIPAIGRRAYRYVADHRLRGACAVPPRGATERAAIRPRPRLPK